MPSKITAFVPPCRSAAVKLSGGDTLVRTTGRVGDSDKQSRVLVVKGLPLAPRHKCSACLAESFAPGSYCGENFCSCEIRGSSHSCKAQSCIWNCYRGQGRIVEFIAVVSSFPLILLVTLFAMAPRSKQPEETADDTTMQDAPPSHQPAADDAEEVEDVGDEEMNEQENYEEEEEEEPQRIRLVRSPAL